ncbi:MAG: hypothetical protein Q9162_001361 [Coniocarpon cinnabarinum]
MPQYFAQNGYADPKDGPQTPWQFGKDTELSLFEWLASKPEEGRAFNSLMAIAHEHSNVSWLHMYPLQRLTDGADIDAPFVVDVGGGVGRDMDNLRQSTLPIQYEIVVQDLAKVVEHGKTMHESLRFMSHDFFQEQPVRRARAYIMSNVLHDWPDAAATTILQKLRPAFVSGYSKLLICDNVLPDTNISPASGALDMLMTGLFSSKERTQTDWKNVLESGGFRISNVFRSDTWARSVIEAEPV